MEELRLFPNSSFLEQILRNQKYSLQGTSWSYKTPNKVVTIKSERFLNPSTFNDFVEKLEKGLKHNETLPKIVETYVNKEAEGIKKSYGFKNIAKYINEDIEKLNKFRITFSEEDAKAYLLGIAHYIICSFNELNKQISKEKIQIEDLFKYFGLITDYINDPILDKWTLVHTAAQNGNTIILPELVKRKADIDKAENNGLSPLHLAAQNGHIEIVQKLPEYGANVNKITHGGFTSIYLATQNGHTEIVQKLLEHGADVNKAANNEAIPLHIAAQNGHIEIVQKLLEHGANVNKAANNGASPLHLAALNEHIEIVQILFDSMKDGKLKKEQLAQSLVLAKKENHTKNLKFLEDCISGKYEAEKIGQNLKNTMISNNDNLTLIKQKGSGIGR